jgi:CelD/BcsL family acetyltransferase involved in cellulose biosynthesis
MAIQEGVFVNISIYDTVDGFEALRGEWNTLLGRSPTDTVFLTWEWQYRWWMAYQPGELRLLAARSADGVLVGIAPLFIDTTDPAERVLRAVGCVDVTDYVDIIIDSAYWDEVVAAFAGAMTGLRDQFDRVNLCNLRAESPTLVTLRRCLEECGCTTEVADQEVCPVITLGDSWDAYLEGLDKKQRHELRRKMRLAYADEDLSWRVVGQGDDLAAQLTDFTRLMAQSSQDKAVFLQNPQHVAFFMSVMPDMLANGWLQLAFLDYRGEPIAAYLNLVYGGRVMVYNSGLNPAHGQLSPGIVLLCHLIRWAAENGVRAFDFLRGNEEYKYRMGGVDQPLYMLKALTA